MATQITMRDLQDRAEKMGIDPNQSYEELREAVDYNTCKWCGDEFLVGWSEKFCTDQCEVEYIHEWH